MNVVRLREYSGAMKSAKKRVIALVSLALVLATLAPAAGSRDGECFTVLVGRKASADGSVMVAHNEDDRGDIVVNLRKIRPRDYGARQKVDLGKGGVFETDGRTDVSGLRFPDQIGRRDLGKLFFNLR